MLKPTKSIKNTTQNDAYAAKRAAFQLEADAIRTERNAITPDRNGLPKGIVDAYNMKAMTFLDRAKAAELSGFYISFIDDCGFDISASRLYYQAWADTVIVLEVPLADKTRAKDLGAKWEPEYKTWYLPADADTGPFQAWIS